MSAYRDAICSLCVRTVSLALAVPLSDIQSGTRSGQDAALARQIAMYLCHTTFSMMMTEVGLYFKRDRTTVAHACAVVEDKRDKFSFDLVICQLEALLLEARQALEHQQAMQGQGAGR
ncbi:MAG: helix-turn-helix domain-containing protein [Pseudomonadota bacterium]